jgi:chitinase
MYLAARRWLRLGVLTLLALPAAIVVTAAAAHAAPPSATFTKTSDWGTGFEAKFTITNNDTAAFSGWTVAFDMPAGTTVGTFWDALMTSSGSHYSFVNRDYNATVAPGQSVTFGFVGAGSGAPLNCTLNGASCAGTGGGGGGGGAPAAPSALRVTGSTNTSISLAWTAPAGTITSYRVYEGTTVRATVTATSATISGLTACTSHSYAVSALNSAGESAKTTQVSATTGGCPASTLPRHTLTGYWQDFTNSAAKLRLSQVPTDYDVVAVAFANATGTPGAVSFAVDSGLSSALGGYTDAQFRADVQTLHGRGTKVILSVGGEAGTVSVSDATSATNFANSVFGIMQSYGFDGVDIDLENGVNPTFMGQALRSLRGMAGANVIITMAPQTIDMQSTGGGYFQLALNIRDILTVVHTQYYNSGTMLGCDQAVYGQGTENFMTALACIQLENGLRPDQVALGLPAGPGAAGGGVVAPSLVASALSCLARATNCGTFVPPRTYPTLRGAMTWSINWDVTNGNNFARTVKPALTALP